MNNKIYVCDFFHLINLPQAHMLLLPFHIPLQAHFQRLSYIRRQENYLNYEKTIFTREKVRIKINYLHITLS